MSAAFQAHPWAGKIRLECRDADTSQHYPDSSSFPIGQGDPDSSSAFIGPRSSYLSSFPIGQYNFNLSSFTICQQIMTFPTSSSLVVQHNSNHSLIPTV